MLRAGMLARELPQHLLKVVNAPLLTAVATCSSAALASPKQRLLPLLDDSVHCTRLMEMAAKDPDLAKILLSPYDAAQASKLNIQVPPLTRQQLFVVAVNNFIPFLGFGFFDNFIMIIAGEALDTTLCVSLGYTTMVAAALGNTMSDVVGIGLGGVIEACAEKLGLPQSDATVEQQRTLSHKLASQAGSIGGIVIGCFLGMVPLAFVDSGQSEEMREQKRRNREMCQMVEEKLAVAVGADRASLFIVDLEKRVLRKSRESDAAGIIEVPLEGDSYVAKCYRAGEALNEHHLAPEASKFGYLMENLLCTPIKSANGVIGVVQMLNKQTAKRFNMQDEHTSSRFAVMLAYLLQKEKGVEQITAILEEEAKTEERDKRRNLTKDIFAQVIKLELVNADRTSFFLVDEDAGSLYTIVAEGSEPIHLEMGKGLVGHVAKTGKSLNVKDAYECPWFDETNDLASGYRTRSAIMMPVFAADGRVLGVLQALNRKDLDHFNEADNLILSDFAAQIGVAIEAKGESFGVFVDNFKPLSARHEQRQSGHGDDQPSSDASEMWGPEACIRFYGQIRTQARADDSLTPQEAAVRIKRGVLKMRHRFPPDILHVILEELEERIGRSA